MKEYMSKAHKQANELLKEISVAFHARDDIQKKIAAETAKITEKYKGDMEIVQSQISDLDKKIRKLEEGERQEFFAEGDRYDLPQGALLYQSVWKVTRIRDALQKLEDAGITEAIRIVKTVKWEEIEKWTDERLAMVGLQRKLKESFEYELGREVKSKK